MTQHISRPLPTRTPARLAASALGLAALAALTACDPDRVLSPAPTTVVAAETAITDPVSAAAAVAGMYGTLADGAYYGTDFVVLGDLSSDNTQHSGTFQTYRQADQNGLLADNTAIAGVWRAIYEGINAANNVIARLGTAAYLDEETRDQYLAEGYLMRALGHHNATKYWGRVPVITSPTTTPAAAAAVTRADTAAVYRQILLDLDSAEALMQSQKQTLQGSLGGVRALRARVLLYRADWAGALAAAQSVNALGYALAPTYAGLFSATGSTTTEDILRLRFNDQNQNSISFYYYPRALGGRYEVSPTANMRQAYTAGDARLTYSIDSLRTSSGSYQRYNNKYRSVSGTEHLHIIRYAEVRLIEAEALARLGRLTEALVPLNAVRARAGLAAYALSGSATQQQELVDAIVRERRLELAFEGDRWPDLVRTGQAVTFLANKPTPAPATQALWPIPQRDIDVASGLQQNPGY